MGRGLAVSGGVDCLGGVASAVRTGLGGALDELVLVVCSSAPCSLGVCAGGVSEAPEEEPTAGCAAAPEPEVELAAFAGELFSAAGGAVLVPAVDSGTAGAEALPGVAEGEREC